MTLIKNKAERKNRFQDLKFQIIYSEKNSFWRCHAIAEAEAAARVADEGDPANVGDDETDPDHRTDPADRRIVLGLRDMTGIVQDLRDTIETWSKKLVLNKFGTARGRGSRRRRKKRNFQVSFCGNETEAYLVIFNAF